MLAVINVDTSVNFPIPYMTVEERDALRRLVDTGREWDAWLEVRRRGNLALAASTERALEQGRAMLKTQQAERRARELHDMQIAQERASEQRASELQTAKLEDICAGKTGPVGAPKKRKGDKWTDKEMRTLQKESIQPGATQQKLAEEYGVSRQAIGAILQRAAVKFRTAKPATQWPPSNAKKLRRN
ncbi:hypothetical protein CF70_021180 [Cupriavidus sp. SK-3]|nr:hypothetical protein CF70_021180 [Cupriavidus sp. SK-3]